MATTTNYSWTTPDDTALVKDGAAAIRSLGTAIDTTVFNNAGAAIAKTIVDAKGDIIAATAADTVSRLAVGANGTVLTAASGQATGLEWATPASGGMTLISTTTLTGASITLSSIPATYNDLYIIIRAFLPATDAVDLNMRFNADSGASRHFSITTNAAPYDNQGFNNTSALICSASDNAVTTTLNSISIPDYTNTTTRKMATTVSLNTSNFGATSFNFRAGYAVYNQTAAISSLVFFPSSGNFTSGTVLLYGVK